MATVTWAPADRERYGLPESIEFHLSRFGYRSVAALRAEAGWSYERMLSRLDGRIVVQADGTETTERDYDAWAALLWLVARSAGHRVTWEDWDPLVVGTVVDLRNTAEEAAAGKDPSPSATAGPNTTTDSPTGSTSSSSPDTSPGSEPPAMT